MHHCQRSCGSDCRRYLTQRTVLCAESNLKVLLSQHTEILVIFEENRTIFRNTENHPPVLWHSLSRLRKSPWLPLWGSCPEGTERAVGTIFSVQTAKRPFCPFYGGLYKDDGAYSPLRRCRASSPRGRAKDAVQVQ